MIKADDVSIDILLPRKRFASKRRPVTRKVSAERYIDELNNDTDTALRTKTLIVIDERMSDLSYTITINKRI